MLNRALARNLMGIVPERLPATVRMYRAGTTIEILVATAWLKPVSGKLDEYGHLQLQGDETLVKIPDHELNASGGPYEIRSEDEIDIDGGTYVVTAQGSTLKTVRTVWECICRKKIS